MNPELYERYLAKKAKKLGISVEELKAQGAPSPVASESSTTSESVSTAPSGFSVLSTPSAQAPVSSGFSALSNSSVQPTSTSGFSALSNTPAQAPASSGFSSISASQEQTPASSGFSALSNPTVQTNAPSGFSALSNTSVPSQPLPSNQPDIYGTQTPAQYSQPADYSNSPKVQSQTQSYQPYSESVTNYGGYTQASQTHYDSQFSQPAQSQDVYEPLKPQPEKFEIPSYIFGPSKMEDSSSAAVPTQAQPPEIKDTRENKFGLIGYPLGHSLSAYIHKAGFESLGIDATYELLETDPEDLVDRVKFFKHENYSGFNVTIPLKLPISLFVNEVDKYADIAGAVNTVKINPDKTFSAYNTDAMGFKKAIPSDISLKGAKVALLGTGGASRAAVLGLSECGVSEIGVYTRNIPNSVEYLNYMRRKFPAIEFTAYQIEQVRDLSKYHMLVNTTPIGMLGRSADMTPIEEHVLKTMPAGAAVYDVIYNPKKTVLLKTAEKLGLRTINGLDMLIYQAVSAQEIWFGRTPDFKSMKIAALENL